GTGDANATVTLKEGATVVGTVVANSSGVWSVTPVLADGNHTILASETDAAGNIGSASLTFTLDTQAPIPIISAESMSGNKVKLDGTSEAGTTVNIYDNGALFTTVTASTGGTWSATKAVSDIVHSFTARAVDLAGNVGTGTVTALLGSSGSDTLTGTSGRDII